MPDRPTPERSSQSPAGQDRPPSSPAPLREDPARIAERIRSGEDDAIERAAAQVDAALRRGDIAAVHAILGALRPPDRVDVVEALPLEDRRRLVELLDDRAAARILEELEDADAAEVAAGLLTDQLAPILDRMEADEAADVLLDLPPAEADRLLTAMDDAAESEVRLLLHHEDETAGGRMTRAFVALRAEDSVAHAIDELRELRPDEEAAYYLYVRDAADRLVGVISIRQLIVAGPDERIGALMRPDVFHVRVDDDQETAARIMARYDLLALPVVDQEGRLAGVISHDDLVDVLEAEATEDMFGLVGLDADDRPLDPVATSVRKRLPWLVLNLGAQLVLVAALKGFEQTLAVVAALAVLFPLVTGQGGNVGAQTMTIVVRLLALGEVNRALRRRLILKELSIGVANGLVIGLLAALIAYVVGGPTHGPDIAAAILLAMVLTLITGSLVGTLVPLALDRFGVDPAVASSVFVTTIADTAGVVFFLGLYTLLSPHLF